jgi:hypothetical protein
LLKYKHKTKRVCYKDKDDVGSKKKTITKYRTTNIQKNDLIFLCIKVIKHLILFLYAELSSSFGKTLDRIGKGEKEDNNEK